jgi:broad specificity phosphatase PhoE
LTDTVARQARALDEVAGFKREAIQILGNDSARARRTADDLARENALLSADVEKKSAELRAMDDLRTRLEHDLTNLRAELERLRSSRGWLRRG